MLNDLGKYLVNELVAYALAATHVFWWLIEECPNEGVALNVNRPTQCCSCLFVSGKTVVYRG